MHNAIKKAFTASVVATTIAWSIGLSAIPFAAKAAASGSLVKASLPAVYYVGSDGKRYVFPNEKTYKTWYSDFSSVQTITDAELAAMPIGGNVTYKPGVRMVKITTDPKVYAVAANGTLRWVSTEAAAVALYGSSWNQMIDDVPDAFFTNYSIGSDIASSSDFSPSSASAAALSINVDKGLSTTADGSLAVMMSSPAAAGGVLPGGAMGVEVLKFDVKNNGSTALTLDSATVKRTGPGATTDFASAGIYIYDGNNRLTTGRTLNSTSHEAVFGGLNLSLDPGATKHLMIAADVAAGPGGGNVNAFQLTALTASGVAASGVPLAGPNFTMSSATVGSVTTATSSTPANPKAGESNVRIASLSLAAGAAEDINLTKLAFTYSGSMNRDYLTNLVLKQSGTTLATVSGVTSKDLINFVLATPYKLEKGSTRVFEVYADISGAARPNTDTIIVYLDQTSDVLAVGSVYGYGVTVTNGYGSGAVPTLTVAGGQLTMTFNGPASADVARDAEDVEIFNITLAAQANLEVRNSDFNCTRGGTLALADITDVKLVDTATGAIVAGPLTYADAMTFTESFYLTAGQARTLKLTVDVENTASDGDTLVCSFGPYATGADVRNLDNSQYLVTADFVPSVAIAGNAMTIRVPALTLSGASTPVSQNYIVGSQGIDLLGFNLKANDASDLKVTQIILKGYMDDDNDGTYDEGGTGIGAGGNTISSTVLTMKLMNGSTQVGDVESASATTGQVTFDNLNLSIPKGQTVGLKLVGNLSSSIATVTAGNQDNIYFDITAVGSVSAEDGDGNPLAAGQKSGAAFNATPSVAMAIRSAGSLSVALAPDDTDSEAGLVVGGSSNAVLGKFKLTAVDEELKLVKARFSVASVATVASLSLYDGATLVGGPVSVDGNGMAYFSGMNFVIPKDGSKVLTVKGNLNSVGSSGATTGLAATVTLQDGYQGAAIDGFFEVRGTSAGSSTLIQEFGTASADNDLAANAKVVRKTKPTISLVTLPTSTLSAGDQTVLRFTVAADAAGDVSFKELVANVTKSGTVTVAKASGGDNFIMKQVGSSYLNATVTYAASVLTIVLANEETVSAGSAKTYDIIMNMSGAVSGDSVTSALQGDTTVATGAYTAGLAGAHNFIWSDQSATAHSLTTADWANGYKVKTLPSDSQTLSK